MLHIRDIQNKITNQKDISQEIDHFQVQNKEL